MEDMVVVFDDYFHSLFRSMTHSTRALDYCFHKVPKRVTECMNASLLAPFTLGKVKLVLDQMEPLKSPGPYGLSA